MIVLCTGSRDLKDYRKVFIRLDFLLQHRTFGEEIFVCMGDCPTGADQFAKMWALANAQERVKFKEFEADWDTYGKAAGPMRNQDMVDFVSRSAGTKKAIAWLKPGSPNKGTLDCISKCLIAKIPLEVVT